MGMQLQVRNAKLQAKVEQWVADTGRPAEELMEELMASYFDELAQTRETLDRRYDDIKSGKVKMIPGEEVEAYFRRKSDALHSHSS